VPRRVLILINLVVITALILGTGAQWFVLQSVAWTNMMVSFSQTASIGEALEKTFDGKNPCDLCKHIRDAKKETEKEKAPHPEFHLQGVIPPVVTAIAPASQPLVYPGFERVAAPRMQSPPSPPPRTV
jgi:hypothetical protein